jgi:serine phosphatase RsbU (regulator of sigma subunit)
MFEEKRKSILIVEDDESFAKILNDYLSTQGYIVQTTVCGEEGFSLVKEHKPDLLILDMCLPDVCGLDVIERIRSFDRNMPIVVVSGISDVSIAIDAVKRGAWDYILKPIHNLRMFNHILEKIWERDQSNKRERNYVERLERHSIAAKQMQERFLPKEKMEWKNYTLAHKMIPSIDSSGDFIDYFKIDESHLGFYIADVAGHGVAAAFLTVILKSTITLYQRKNVQMKDDSILHPERMLKVVNNEMLLEDYQKHITMFYGVVNVVNNTLTFANAGIYPYPIMYNRENKSFIEHKGLPLGIVEEADYQEETLELPEEFALLLFSDGILEILPEQDPQYTKEELLNYLTNLDSDENDVLNKVNTQISTYGEPNIPDDISFLLIKRTH